MGWPNVVVGEAMMMSHMSASSRPPSNRGVMDGDEWTLPDGPACGQNGMGNGLVLDLWERREENGVR